MQCTKCSWLMFSEGEVATVALAHVHKQLIDSLHCFWPIKSATKSRNVSDHITTRNYVLCVKQ